GVTLNFTKAGTTVRHAKRPVTACELAEAKGPKRFRSDPFSVVDIHQPGEAPVSDLGPASAFPGRLGRRLGCRLGRRLVGFLDGRLVIPAVAAESLVEAVVAERTGGCDFVIAAPAEGRATPGRE